ncbi:MAG: DUF4235 domain-containing protein [Gemmatimonadaceae bacterium]|nr:DUF4235 domain-containing protein [Gemmatimonadaceae bacterium]
MTPAARKAAWMIVGAGAAMVASTLIERSLAAGWRAATSDDPPYGLKTRDAGWRHALLWAAASALALGLGEAFARQGAAVGWERLTGKEPPA